MKEVIKLKNKEIEFETLHSNKHRIYFLFGIVCVVVLMVTLIVTTSKAKYKTTESMPLLNGTINYTLADLNIVEMYLNGEAIDSLPDGNYELTEESYCTNAENVRDESITLNYDGSTKIFTVAPFNKKGTKCYLYFEEGASAGETILASENAPTNSTTDWTNSGTGITYYYTGNPNNWVQFGGFYWRIIRINGDGTIRMIYQGTSANTTGEGTQIGTSAFNSSNNNNAYLGYMYTIGQVHGLGTSSTIKGILDTWYNTYIENEQSNIHYGQYIDGNAGFCGDRTPSTSSNNSNGSGGTGTIETYYGAYIRLARNNSPSLQCSDNADIYTTIDSSTGNQALTYPIGLISADEAIFAGIPWTGYNQNNYLYTNTNYWTMSPSSFVDDYAFMYFVSSSGNIPFTGVGASNWAVRPVINLKSAIAISGSGTTSDPFKVVGA